jgi:hypothetical protein
VMAVRLDERRDPGDHQHRPGEYVAHARQP